MNINPITNSSLIPFGYSHLLKTLFKEGKMPTVTKGLYGHLINKDNVSLEHLKPHSMGGRSILSNFALAERTANSARGNRPLAEFLTKEMLEKYLSQFNFKISGKFNGFQYQEMIRKTCENEGVGDVAKKIVRSLPSGDSFIKSATEQGIEGIRHSSADLGNLKYVIEHLDEIDILSLSKKMLKALKNRGLIN